MTKKTVSMSRKPGTQKQDTNPDAWVTHRGTSETQKMKRLTIDVPQDLHVRIKTQCAQRGSKMADEIRMILEREFHAS